MFNHKFINSETFQRLYPGEDGKKKYQKYRIRKQKYICIVLVIGMMFAICVHLSSQMQNKLADGASLIRNEWGEGNYPVKLLAQSVFGEELLEIEIAERELTSTELEILRQQAVNLLPGMILGKNDTLLSVREDLNLVHELEGFPFSITWKISNYNYVGADGKIKNDDVGKFGEEVVLTAVLSYAKESWEENFTVCVMPKLLSSQETYQKILIQSLEKTDEKYENDAVMVLPDKIGNETVIWKEKKENVSVYFIVVSILVSVMLAIDMDEKIKKKMKIREAELESSYPEFVSQLQLYMGAGITVRKIFDDIGKEYQKTMKRGGKKQFLCEEILIANHQFENGKPEEEVYREWGNKCGIMQYRKLAFLLSSHVRQGNDKILEMLVREVYHVMEERKNRAKKLGEEAGTKLLFPMMIMLLIVMFLILFPAFSGFGTI